MQNPPRPTNLERPSNDALSVDAVEILKEARLHLRETIGFCSTETSTLLFKTAHNMIERSDLSAEEQARLGRELQELS